MKYRTLGNIKDRVSCLGFGSMRFLTDKDGNIIQEKVNELIKTAMESGITYYDTAYVYHDEHSEKALAEGLKPYPRESYTLADKLPVHLVKSEDELDGYLDRMLERLNTTYIDFFLLHAMSFERFEKVKLYHIGEWLDRKKAEGKIRYAGFSIHEKDTLIDELLSYYPFDFAQIMLNYMDVVHEPGMVGYEKLTKANVPVIIMEPLRGGSLANIPDFIAEPFKKYDAARSYASYSFRWLLNYPNIMTILSGMNEMDQLLDNIKTFNDETPVSKEELEAVNQVRDELMTKQKVPCTGCRYCMPCPFGVDIPGSFKAWNDRAKARYTEEQKAIQLPAESPVNCQACGRCESLCPQHIQIIDMLKKCNKEMTKE